MATEKQSFTPGPWSADERGMSIWAVNAKIGGEAKIFDVRGWGYLTGHGHGGLALTHDEAEAIQLANAKLAASAPDLLAALKMAREYMDVCLGAPTYMGENPYPVMDAAIAKATGAR